MTIVDFPEAETGQLDIRGLVDAKRTSSDMKARFPDLRISTSRTAIKATGAPSLLAEIKRVLVQSQDAILDEKNLAPMTLTTRASRKAILMKIAEVTGKKFSFASATLDELTEQVSVNVKNVSVHELIKQVLKGSDLTYELNETQLKILK
jgi:hypothetical protein